MKGVILTTYLLLFSFLFFVLSISLGYVSVKILDIVILICSISCGLVLFIYIILRNVSINDRKKIKKKKDPLIIISFHGGFEKRYYRIQKLTKGKVEDITKYTLLTDFIFI